MEFEQVCRLPEKDSGPSLSIVRFNNCLIDSKKQDRNKFYRREPVMITNVENKQSILRYAMGSAGNPIKKNALAIDYDGVDFLGINYKKTCKLLVKKATTLDCIKWFWNYSDLSVQLSIRLGLLGLMLGILGLLLGILTIF